MKTKLLAAMLVFGAMNASAQLTVYHNGNVNIGSEQPTSNVSLSLLAMSHTATPLIMYPLACTIPPRVVTISVAREWLTAPRRGTQDEPLVCAE